MIGLAKRVFAAAMISAAAGTTLGCELIATVDRGKIPSDNGNGGGTTTTTTATTTTTTTTTTTMDVCGDGKVTGAERAALLKGLPALVRVMRGHFGATAAERAR